MSSPHPQEWTIAVSRGRMFAFGPRVSEPTEVVPKSSRDRLEAALLSLEPFLRATLAEDVPEGGWPYDVSSPAGVNPRIRAALEALASVGDEGERP